MSATAQKDPFVLDIGEQFAGRYRILRLIDRGQSGRVYQAEQVPLKRVVALKILDVASEDAAQLGRHAERFLREASHLGRLSSPHTVRVWDYGVVDGRPYIAMEFVDGESLRRLLDRQRLPALRTIRIARQICTSLAEAHFLGLVHRDLKPANVLLTQDLQGEDLVKVADFGLVKDTEDAVQMTGEGLMLGTPMYMSPEQIKGGAIDARSDLYAVGVLLFRALTGTFPFRQSQHAQVLMAHLTTPPATFAEADPDLSLPECVEWTVQTCLQKSIHDRFANVEELARALKLCEAALLDDDTASATILRLELGRVVLPEAIYGTTTRRSSAWGPAIQWAIAGAAGVGSLLLAFVVGVVVVGQWWRVGAPDPSAQVPDASIGAPAPPRSDEAPTAVPAQPEPAPPPPVAAPEPAAPEPAAPDAAAPKPAAPKPAAPKPPGPVLVNPAPPSAPAPQPAGLGSDLVDPWSPR